MADDSLMEFIEANAVAEATSINPTDIDSELIRMAALYSRFGVLAARARSQRDARKSSLELVEAKLDKLLRDKFAEKGEKVTENKIRSELVLQKAYVEAIQELNEANSILSVAETTLSSLEMKRDMLVQLNKNAEREWQYSSAMVPTDTAKGIADEAIRNLATQRARKTA
jgi:hypothetical protein